LYDLIRKKTTITKHK